MPNEIFLAATSDMDRKKWIKILDLEVLHEYLLPTESSDPVNLLDSRNCKLEHQHDNPVSTAATTAAITAAAITITATTGPPLQHSTKRLNKPLPDPAQSSTITNPGITAQGYYLMNQNVQGAHASNQPSPVQSLNSLLPAETEQSKPSQEQGTKAVDSDRIYVCNGDITPKESVFECEYVKGIPPKTLLEQSQWNGEALEGERELEKHMAQDGIYMLRTARNGPGQTLMVTWQRRIYKYKIIIKEDKKIRFEKTDQVFNSLEKMLEHFEINKLPETEVMLKQPFSGGQPIYG